MNENDNRELAQALMLRQRQQQESMIMYQLETQDILQEIENYLKAVEYDPETNKFIRKKDQDGKIIPPIANDRGVNAIIDELKPRVHKGITLSNFSEEKIDVILWEVNQVVINMLEAKYKDFDIDPVFLPNIVNMIDHLLEAQFYRALNEGERKRLYPTQQTVQHLHQQTENQEDKARFKLFGKKLF